MDQQRDFKGIWISKDIWLDKRITALEKIILMEIDSLDIDEQGCYASNDYLAEFCNCTSTKVSLAIKKLIKLGYIETVKFDGRKRYVKSRLSQSVSQTLTKLKADFNKVKDINIDNNIDNNNINIYTCVIDYLNQKANTNFRSTTTKTRTLIRARIKEGFKQQDFEKVIDNKVKEWLGSEMEKYLRPETLFGTKFESYLNQKIKNNKPDWFDQKIQKKKVELTDEEKQYFGIE